MKSSNSQILHELSFYPKKRKELLLSLSQVERANIFLKLSKHVQTDILKKLDDQELIDTIEHLDMDMMVDTLMLLSPKRRQKITEMLGQAMQQDIKFLSEFDPQTAAGLMNINYIQVEHSKTMMDVADKFKTHEKRTGRQPKIIVTDEGKAVGYLSGYILGQAKPQDKIDAHVRKLNTVNFDDSHKAVIKRFSENRHGSAAVLGKNGNILGIIYADDLLRLSNLQEDQSLYNFAGVSKEESVGDSISQKVRARYKWLMINLGTAFLASSVVGLFDGVIAEHVLLAVYMPIVAGMGGNAGTQTLAVMVRGISLREIELKNAWVALRREVMAGLTNGLINGLIVALVVMVINRDIQLAIVLGLAMIFSLTVAGFSGTLVPLIMHKLGKDPAASATVFITTVTDVFGFMAFLGLASLVMG